MVGGEGILGIRESNYSLSTEIYYLQIINMTFFKFS